jgi:hypothetical protein
LCRASTAALAERLLGRQRGSPVQDFDWAYEAITLPDHGFDELRCLWIVMEGDPQPADDPVDALVSVNVNVVGPECGGDLLARGQLTSPSCEQDEQVHGLALETDSTSLVEQLVADNVQLKAPG